VEPLLEKFEVQLQAAARGDVPIMWEDDDGPERLRATGRLLLSIYHETFRPRRVLAVERQFSIARLDPNTGRELDERLVGIADLIEEDDQGAVWITELKTAARRFDGVRLGYDHQATIYAMARAALGFPDARVRFRVLLKTKKPAIETYELRREEPQFRETSRVVHQVLRAVDAGIFFPHRGWQCANCPFRAACGT
jgi:RecB family exonuclease